MRAETHRARHMRLHDALDELVSDFLRYHPNQDMGVVTVQALFDWSGEQAMGPTEPDAADPHHHNGSSFHEPTDDERDSGNRSGNDPDTSPSA